MTESSARVPNVTIDMLRQNRLFQGVDSATIELLLHELKPELTQPGDCLMREGDDTNFMFAILTGEVEVVAHGGSTGADVRVALLGPSDWVGEMTLLGGETRSATVRALAPTLLLRLTAADVKRLIQDRDAAQYAQIIMNIARELGRRLRVADRLIARSRACGHRAECGATPHEESTRGEAADHSAGCRPARGSAAAPVTGALHKRTAARCGRAAGENAAARAAGRL
jgi:CRP/FNR family cyclic AMP-dependent transcriptional regulator